MNTLLFKLFVKDYENCNDPKVREDYGKLAGFVGVISNLIICTIKIVAGVLASSISIIADGVNNLADAASSVITLVGFKLAAMPEDEEHPYGHARIEYIAGLIVSIIIIFVGFSLAKESVGKIFNPEAVNFTNLTIVILVISIALKIWQALFNYSAGKKINSTALMATAADSRNDCLATTAVLISALIARFTGENVDALLGVAVAIFIIISGIGLIKETISPLLGESPDEELVKEIADFTLKHEGVIGIHDLVVHNYGPGKIFASIHVEVDADKDIMETHDLVDNIEKELSEKHRIHLVAHMDPIKLDCPVINEIREPLEICVAKIEGVRNIHDLRCVPGTTHTNIIFDVVMENGCPFTEKEIIEKVNKVVKDINPSYFVVITFDKMYTNL